MRLRFNKDLPSKGRSLSGARKTLKIGDLPDDVQSLLGQIAMDTNGFMMRDDADFEKFKNVKLPAFMVPLDSFPEVDLEQFGDDRPFEDYLDTPIENFPPVVIAHGFWIDGRHRVWAAREKGVEAIQTIDASSIFGKKIVSGWGWLGQME